MKTNVPTRRSEISYWTSDPASMLNKYIAQHVNKTYTKNFVNPETGETTAVEHTERLFDRGTLIDQNTLESIRFSLAAGEIRRIRVSNQRRVAQESSSYSHLPFRAKAVIRSKPHTFILYAKSLRTALLILADYIELNFEGAFSIIEVRATDYITILTDPGYILPGETDETPVLPLTEDLAYSPEPSLSVPASGASGARINEPSLSVSAKEPLALEEDDPTKNHRFYQITAHITAITEKKGKVDKWEYDQTFLVRTISCARANRIILYWLRLRQLEENRKLLAKDPDAQTDEKTFLSQVEESKVVPIRHYIPREFSLAYSDYDDSEGQTTSKDHTFPEGSYTFDTPPAYSKEISRNGSEEN